MVKYLVRRKSGRRQPKLGARLDPAPVHSREAKGVRHGTQSQPKTPQSEPARHCSTAPKRSIPRLLPGRRRHVQRPRTFETRGHAEGWLAIERTDRLRGTWRDPRQSQGLQRDLIAGWLDSRRLAPRTRDLYASLAARWINRPLAWAGASSASFASAVSGVRGRSIRAAGP